VGAGHVIAAPVVYTAPGVTTELGGSLKLNDRWSFGAKLSLTGGDADHPSGRPLPRLPRRACDPMDGTTARATDYDGQMEQDTAPQRRDRYIELLRSLTPGQRLARAADLTATVRRLGEVGIRQRFPNASEEEVRIRLAVRIYGRELAQRWYEALPDDAR
jgi:hypothetical protein